MLRWGRVMEVGEGVEVGEGDGGGRGCLRVFEGV